MRPVYFLALAVSCMLLARGATPAHASYSIQPVVKLGDKAGDVLIRLVDGQFEVGTLNDNGQISLVTDNADGGEVLLQYAGGALSPLVVGERDAPGGKWPRDVGIFSPVSMNQLGSIGFAADVTVGSETSIGTFLWDFPKQQFTPIVQKSLAEFFRLTLERGGNWLTAINNGSDMAFSVTVLNQSGQSLSADYFRGRDGRLIPIAVPDQILPDGSSILDACSPHLNDSAVVGFLVRRRVDGDKAWSAYRWEGGAITPVAVVGTDIPGLGKLATVLEVWVNNKNRNVLLAVRVGAADTPGPLALCLYSNGILTPLVVPGQNMPGGGQLRNIQDFGISYPNDSAQQAFLATLTDNSTAAYLMDADGKLSLILKSGTATSLGPINNVGQGSGNSTGIGLNNKGQVATTLQIGGGVDTVAVLTPQ